MPRAQNMTAKGSILKQRRNTLTIWVYYLSMVGCIKLAIGIDSILSPCLLHEDFRGSPVTPVESHKTNPRLWMNGSILTGLVDPLHLFPAIWRSLVRNCYKKAGQRHPSYNKGDTSSPGAGLDQWRTEDRQRRPPRRTAWWLAIEESSGEDGEGVPGEGLATFPTKSKKLSEENCRLNNHSIQIFPVMYVLISNQYKLF